MAETRKKFVAITLCTAGCATMLLGSLLLTSNRRLVWGLVLCGASIALSGYLMLSRSKKSIGVHPRSSAANE